MKNNMPLVSVVVCEHNTDIAFLRDSITSILEQDYSFFELIIVDDCSSTEYADEDFLKDPRVKILKNKTNRGLAASRNIGIDNSNGKYIAIMDTDDICHKNRLRAQVKYLEKHNDIVCVGSYVRLFGKRKCTQRYNIKNNEYYRCCLLFGNSPTLTNPSVMIRAELFKNNKVRYDERLKTSEDYDMWVQLSNCGKIATIKRVLLDYRIRDGQMSEVFRSEDLNEYNWAIVKKQLSHLGFNQNNFDEKFIRTSYKKEIIDAFDYYVYLMELQKSNLTSMYYNIRCFRKRCRKQWKQKVYYTIDQKKIKRLLKVLPKAEKNRVIIWMFFRPFNLVVRFYDFLRHL